MLPKVRLIRSHFNDGYMRAFSTLSGAWAARRPTQRLSPTGDDRDIETDDGGDPSAVSRREDLPYKVELWDEKKSTVEQVLAVTRNGSIGYAAYYEATRQFPNRYVTLRHKGRILSRFNGPTH